MILRKDYVQQIQKGLAQVEIEKTEEHNKMLNLIFQERKNSGLPDFFYYVAIDKFGYGYDCEHNPFENLPIIHASDIILDNTVIKVESEEQGKRVIEWWKEQGVDTRNRIGDGFLMNCYGIYNGIFDSRSEDVALRLGKKIITLPKSFPSKWYLKINDSNKEVANEWRRSVARTYLDVIPHDGEIVISEPYKDGSYYLAGDSQKAEVFNLNLKEISLEQFLEHVYVPWKNRLMEGQEIMINETKQEEKMRTITWNQGQEIIDIACAEWKERLFTYFGKNIVLKQTIEVQDEHYRQMRKACTKEQHELFDKIFGKEKEEIDLCQKTGIGKLGIFQPDGNSDNSLMAIFDTNRIWLNPIGFKWKLDKNILTIEQE